MYFCRPQFIDCNNSISKLNYCFAYKTGTLFSSSAFQHLHLSKDPQPSNVVSSMFFSFHFSSISNSFPYVFYSQSEIIDLVVFNFLCHLCCLFSLFIDLNKSTKTKWKESASQEHNH